MTLHDKSNLRHTIQEHKNFREHGVATVSEPKPTNLEQVCLPRALWNLWQNQRPGCLQLRTYLSCKRQLSQQTTEHRQVSSGD